MNNANVYPLDRSECAPMPETVTRRAVKYAKADIARLKRQIRAEEIRISLQQEQYALEERLRTLRTPTPKTDW